MRSANGIHITPLHQFDIRLQQVHISGMTPHWVKLVVIHPPDHDWLVIYAQQSVMLTDSSQSKVT